MRLGMVGLGRMGANMTVRLLRGGHEVVGLDVNATALAEIETEGAETAHSVEELVESLEPPRTIWMMVPAGPVTEENIGRLGATLEAGDLVVDGGNSLYADTIRRAEELGAKGIELVDSGTSGGIWGLQEGYCLMIGGSEAAFERLQPVLETLATPSGYARVGGPGAGHFVKMIHNGVEYALMQAYGEGFDLLQSSRFDLDLAQIAELWRHGSVVRSWLLDLAAQALAQDPTLESVLGYIEDSGEGRWTIEHALDNAIPAPAIADALFARFSSRREAPFSAKLLAALRKEFGGHATRTTPS